MDWFTLTYTFLGGLGIFFFGIKTLSESLQNLAGTIIRRVINTLTTNRFLAVGVGALVTTIVQSSSVTTVMVVGLANAGLLDLAQAIGVIFGANIGTTITGWIIAIKVGKYGLLFIALGMIPIMLPAANPKAKTIGRLLLALGMIFLGLQYMGNAFKPLRGHEDFLALMQIFAADSYLSLWACIGIGACLTFIVQSSSAMLGITIALASSGAIPFLTAAALVLGENVGTTVTALLASIGTNRSAKQAAYAHITFNVLGVICISTIFWFYADLVDSLIAGNPDFVDADGNKPFMATHIAAGHSLFNVINVILFLPFIKPLARFVTKLTPVKEGKETPHLEYLPGMTPSLAVSAAQKQLVVLADIVCRALALTQKYLLSASPKYKTQQKIEHYEEVSDNIQAEITIFISKTQTQRMTEETSKLGLNLIRAADELESIADYCASLVRYKNRLNENRQSFTDEAQQDLSNFIRTTFSLVEATYISMEKNQKFDLEPLKEQTREYIIEANRIRDIHLKRLEEGRCNPSAGMVFNDMIIALRKIRSHAVNLVETLSGMKTGYDFDHNDTDHTLTDATP